MTPLDTIWTEKGTMRLLFKPEEFSECLCTCHYCPYVGCQESPDGCHCLGTGRKLPEVGDWWNGGYFQKLKDGGACANRKRHRKVLSVRVVTAYELHPLNIDRMEELFLENGIDGNAKLIEVEVDH